MKTNGWTVGPVWRALGAGLALLLVGLGALDERAINVLFRVDARLIDQWQRLSGADEPSGEVVVVGIDSDAIREKGRWPWARADIAELVEIIEGASPRSLTLDILLTEPGPYSEINLLRAFRANGPAVHELLETDPDIRLANAIGSLPTALSVAAGARGAIDELSELTFCADPGHMASEAARSYYVECLLLPLQVFDAKASGYAITFAEQDLDGVIRRVRAFVGQPYTDANGETAETILTGMSVAALTVCAQTNDDCPRFDPEMSFLKTGAEGGFSLPLSRGTGEALMAPSITPQFGLWLDFGALVALGPRGDGDARMISAAALFQDDPAEIARLADRHVLVGYTRLGGIDQHTTPLALESGAPGVLIQALGADNIVAGRTLKAPQWASDYTLAFGAAMALFALFRFGVSSVVGLAALGLTLAAAPIAISWAAFECGALVLPGGTPALAALLAGAPVLYGRILAIRRDLSTAREASARDEERMEAARAIQLGSLPFEADFSPLGFETASICRPAQEVGGDFFELFQLSDGRLFAAVGDVSGKGLEASLVTALSKSFSGAVTDRVDGPLGTALAEVSREFIRQAPQDWRREKGGFVTFVAAAINPATGAAEFACAGCEPPTVVSADGTRRAVDLPAVAPLGWIEDAAFSTARMTMAPGDIVAMFTDGVTEAETPDGELLGFEKAEEIAAAAAPGGAVAVVDALEVATRAHQAGGDPTDDTTVLALCWRGPPAVSGGVS